MQISILICGNYGYRASQVDGQTIKTRTLKEGFVTALGEANVKVVDSSYFIQSPFRILNEIRGGFKTCSHVLILPGSRGLQVLLPFFLYWKKAFGPQVRYIVIGGWLPALLAHKGWLRRLCARLDGIYVETNSMMNRLKDINVRNVHVLPNFRNFNRSIVRSHAPTTRPLKLVFYSRVMKTKGVELAVASLARINGNHAGPPRVVLDVYGPIAGDYSENAGALFARSAHVRYQGVLTGDIHAVLQHYDLMLFPTYYDGEGFPGAIVDAFIAGLPVVASDWKYNREIVDDGRTGLICTAQSVDSLTAKLEECIENPMRISEMRMNCMERAKILHVDYAVAYLLQEMGHAYR